MDLTAQQDHLKAWPLCKQAFGDAFSRWKELTRANLLVAIILLIPFALGMVVMVMQPAEEIQELCGNICQLVT